MRAGAVASAERRFREALLFPHRYPENGGLGYIAAPYAVEEPERVRNDSMIGSFSIAEAADRTATNPSP